jgi:hypothetical protein
VLDVGLVLEQEVDDVAMTLPAGEGQRNVVLTTRRHIDPRTMEEEKLGYREMAFPEGGREREGKGRIEDGRRERGRDKREREGEKERGREGEHELNI